MGRNVRSSMSRPSRQVIARGLPEVGQPRGAWGAGQPLNRLAA